MKSQVLSKPKNVASHLCYFIQDIYTLGLHPGDAATHLTASVTELRQPLGQQAGSREALQKEGEETAQPRGSTSTEGKFII